MACHSGKWHGVVGSGGLGVLVCMPVDNSLQIESMQCSTSEPCVATSGFKWLVLDLAVSLETGEVWECDEDTINLRKERSGLELAA